MKFILNKAFILLFSILFFILLSSGHHFDTPLAKKYPALDLNDIYTFKAKNTKSTAFVMSLNHTTEANSGSNFAENGLYQFHIAFNKELIQGFTLTFKFKDNKVSSYLIETPTPRIGEIGKEFGQGHINKILDFDNGFKLFTGASKDPFQGNSSGIRNFRKQADKGLFDLSVFDVGEEGNLFGTFQSSIISFEIPNEYLSEIIHYHASTSVLEKGEDHWHKVNRIGHVLFPHMYLIGGDNNTKRTNLSPIKDFELQPLVAKTIEKYVELSGYKTNPKRYADSLSRLILPDVVSYKVGSKANYGLKSRNGRKLKDDAMDVAFALMIGSSVLVDDKVSIKAERIQDEFPYVKPIEDDFILNKDKSETITAINQFKLVSQKVKSTDDFKSQKKSSKKGKSNFFIYYIVLAFVLAPILYLYFKKRKK